MEPIHLAFASVALFLAHHFYTMASANNASGAETLGNTSPNSRNANSIPEYWNNLEPEVFRNGMPNVVPSDVRERNQKQQDMGISILPRVVMDEAK